MLVFPNSKINLGLYVTEKRSDGFHNLETIFYPIPLNDIVEVIKRKDNLTEKVLFTNTGITVDCSADKNLCIKAYNLLDNDFALPPVEIILHKAVPMGAGLGGGSADAAFTLSLLNGMFGLGLDQEKLAGYASQLGSDCAFFIYNIPMLGTGRGEILEPVNISLKGYSLVLVKPDIHVGTAEAYRGVKLEKPELPLTEIISRPVYEWKTWLKNNFEENIFRNHPAIAAIKEKLYDSGALYACMSGSGSTVFGIFEKPAGLERQFQGCFYWEGVMES
jgi:4-diphosphocytidyl-2-C-methyl-D-erythritol kinase